MNSEKNELEKLYEERTTLRDHIKRLWKEGTRFTESDKEISRWLGEVHKKVVEIELQDESLPKERVLYAVCGWEERHSYFRAKNFVDDNLEACINQLEVLKKDESWKTPTIIVKETYFRSEQPAMVDFDLPGQRHFSFSNRQELVAKHMMGTRSYRWKELIKENDTKFTY